MIYFIGEQFLKQDNNYNVIDYVQSEITIDSLYITLEDFLKFKNVKNNIVVIDKQIDSKKVLKKFQHNNFIINIGLKNKTIEKIAVEIINIIEANKTSDYEILSKVYDQMQSRIDYSMYDSIFKEYLKSGNTFLELGSGTGNVTKRLINFNQNVTASDISNELLEKLKQKYPTLKTEYIDITNINSNKKYDSCGMFLDTLNYVQGNKLKVVFEGIHSILEENGFFIFDIHSEYKIKEFDGYIEEIDFKEFFFNWLSYQSGENEITHRFLFVNNETIIEEHKQYIYSQNFYKEKFEKYFKIECIKEVDNRIIFLLKKK